MKQDKDPIQLPDDALENWTTPELFTEENPQFEVPQINYTVRQRDINGLDKAGAVTKFGRKHYIHKQRFVKWFNSRLSSKRAINSGVAA